MKLKTNKKSNKERFMDEQTYFTIKCPECKKNDIIIIKNLSYDHIVCEECENKNDIYN